MSDLELEGCGNHGCRISPPKGMGGNGRCMCGDVRMQRNIHVLKRRIAELERYLGLVCETFPQARRSLDFWGYQEPNIGGA